MKYSIKKLTAADSKSIKDIYDLVFPISMNKDLHYAWRNRIDTLSFGIFTSSGDLVGFILSDIGGYKFTNLMINFIAIHPHYQSCNLGSKLLSYLLKKCVTLNLSVILTPVPTDRIINWYKSHGFYTTYIGKATDGGVYRLMGFHTYGTRSQTKYLSKLMTNN